MTASPTDNAYNIGRTTFKLLGNGTLSDLNMALLFRRARIPKRTVRRRIRNTFFNPIDTPFVGLMAQDRHILDQDRRWKSYRNILKIGTLMRQFFLPP